MFEQFGVIKNTLGISYFNDRPHPDNESWVYVYDNIGAGRQIIEFDEVKYVRGYALLVDGHYELFFKGQMVRNVVGIHAYALVFEKPPIEPSAQLLDDLEQFLENLIPEFTRAVEAGVMSEDRYRDYVWAKDMIIREFIKSKRNEK